MLVNHFADSSFYDNHINQIFNQLRPTLRLADKLVYALVDFNCSIMFSPTSTPSERRLPARESTVLPCNIPPDVYQGELDYDPFAYDVGSLGMIFCEEFQQVTKMVPMLAPLFDGMILRKIDKRFTAQEALQFFEQHVVPSVSPSQACARPPRPHIPTINPELYDRWDGLDPEFVRTWDRYRLPRLTWSTRALRWICNYDIGYAVVQLLRKAIRAV
ncbi:hypothetical protein F5I97DRAFT_1909263, partial [Phlebopus sp. FC_14]